MGAAVGVAFLGGVGTWLATRATDEIDQLTDGSPLAVEVLAPGEFESGHPYAPYYVLPAAAGVEPVDVPASVVTDGSWPDWARQHGAVDGSPQVVQIQLRGTSAEPVLIDGLKIRVGARSDPLEGWYVADPGGGAARVRTARVDLDAQVPDPVYVDDDGIEQRRFALAVTNLDPEIMPVRSGRVALALSVWFGVGVLRSSRTRSTTGAHRKRQNRRMVSTGRSNDPRLSFNAAAAVYDEIRPTYPPEMFDTLFALLPSQPEIVEVGPGTGQATKDLLARGADVHAIDIGPAMAARLRSNLPSDRLRVSVGDFEAIDIAAASADALFSATAYHWIAPEARLDRPAAILHRGGIVAIVDLVQVSSPEDRGFFAAAQPIYQRYGEGHSGPPAPARDDVEPAIRAALASDLRFGDVAVRRYDWDQTYSATDYRKLMLSYSTTQMMDDDDRIGLLDDIESYINERFDGYVNRTLVVTLTTATLL